MQQRYVLRLPVCQDGWHEVMNLPEAFAIHTYAGTTYEFAPHLGLRQKKSVFM
jgi:hypothetical protein